MTLETRNKCKLLRILLLLLLFGQSAWRPLSAVARQVQSVDVTAAAALAIPTSATGIVWAGARSATNNDDEVVYLDAAGYLRVIDPTPPTTDATVQWLSPIGGWRDFALADMNGDGDLEIVAVGGERDSGRLTIYDPVQVSGTVDAGHVINQIPWAELYSTPLLGRPLEVETGDLNPDIPGPEIAFVFELNPADRIDPASETRLSLLQAVPADGAAQPDGTKWESLATGVEFVNTWERLSLGDLDNQGGEEIILVDDSIGVVVVYRIEESVEDEVVTRKIVRLYENKSGNRPWLDSTVARFVPGPINQLVLARSTTVGGESLWVLYYNDGSDEIFSDSYAEFFLPPPRTVFAGDIDANGDDEIFMLRSLPANDTTRPHLIMRNYNNGSDPLPTFEVKLDADNGYMAGDTGDIDGDGRAEVIIMRNNTIRVYTTPESTSANFQDFQPAATTNQRTVHAGNLDRNGYIKLPQLGVVPLQFDMDLSRGERSSPSTFTLSNLSQEASGPIGFTIAIEGEPDWLQVSPRTGNTDTTVNVQFDAAAVAAGTYHTRIIVSTTTGVVLNAPVAIVANLTVRPGLVPAVDMVAAV
ncbi:MAG: VCBS repeat-containing protein [Caldilineaceae bacterium]